MKTLLLLTLSGSALALLLLALRYLFLKRMPSAVYYYAWLLVLLRFALPLPGLVPDWNTTEPAQPEPVRVTERLTEADPKPVPELSVPDAPVREAVPEPRTDTAPIPAPELPRQESPAQSTVQSDAQSAVQSAPARSAVGINFKDPSLWLWVWAAGTLVSLAVPVGAYLRFSRALHRTLRKPEDGVLRQYAAIPGKKPPIYVSRAARTPLTLGC